MRRRRFEAGIQSIKRAIKHIAVGEDFAPQPNNQPSREKVRRQLRERQKKVDALRQYLKKEIPQLAEKAVAFLKSHDYSWLQREDDLSSLAETFTQDQSYQALEASMRECGVFFVDGQMFQIVPFSRDLYLSYSDSPCQEDQPVFLLIPHASAGGSKPFFQGIALPIPSFLDTALLTIHQPAR